MSSEKTLVPVWSVKFKKLGEWTEGTKVHVVLSDLRKKLGLLPDEGMLLLNEAVVGSDEELRQGGGIYGLQITAPACSAYEVCNTRLPWQYDGTPTKKTTGGIIAVKLPVSTDSNWKELQLQLQRQLPQLPEVYHLPDTEPHFENAKKERRLVEALLFVVLVPVNKIIKRYKSYRACWQASEDYIAVSSSSKKRDRSDSDPSNENSRSRRRIGSDSRASSETSSSCSTESDNSHSNRATNSVQAAAAAAAAHAEGNPHGAAATRTFRLCMDPFGPERDVAEVKKALRDQAEGLAARIPQPKSSLRADMHFCAFAREWHQEQQVLRASAAVGDISSSVFITSPPPASGRGGTSGSQQAPTAASAPTAAGSSAAAAAASPGEKLTYQPENDIILITMEVKPSSIVCQAFNMDQATFLQCVDGANTEQERAVFSLAAQCKVGNQMALDIVSQSVGYPFFTGTRYFVISCYRLHWIGELKTVKEVVGADGKIGLEATITLSDPIFGKDAGPDYATARGMYLLLAELVLHHPYDIRQIALPDAVVDTTTAVVNPQGDPDDDTQRGDRDDPPPQPPQQQPPPPQPPQQQKQQQHQQQQPPQQQQQPPSSHQIMASPAQPFKYPYQYFRAIHVRLQHLVSDGETAQVFRGIYQGREVIIKTLSLLWEPAGYHLYEAAMYYLLHSLQQAGVLCRLLAHGEYYGLRYFMIFAPAAGIPLSQLPKPYNTDLQQAVQAAVARLHQHDVIHDDLHEDNIFVQLTAGAAPKVTLIDLGRARVVSNAQMKQQELRDLKKVLQG